MTCRPKSRSGRCRFRSWQSFSGRLSTIATGRQWYSRASATSGWRASGWTLVASTTVSRPAASRFRAMKCSTSKASLVAARLFSSSLTSPRHVSDDSTSVARKCLRAKLDFPDPETPTRTTRHTSGMASFTSAMGEDRHLGGWSDHRILRADRGDTYRVAEAPGHVAGPCLELGPRPLETMTLVPQASRRQALEPHVVFHIWRRQHDHTRPGELEQHALERGQARRVEVLDDLDDSCRVVARQAPVTVGQRAVKQP